MEKKYIIEKENYRIKKIFTTYRNRSIFKIETIYGEDITKEMALKLWYAIDNKWNIVIYEIKHNYYLWELTSEEKIEWIYLLEEKLDKYFENKSKPVNRVMGLVNYLSKIIKNLEEKVNEIKENNLRYTDSKISNEDLQEIRKLWKKVSQRISSFNRETEKIKWNM